jgi:hypothetical protein
MRRKSEASWSDEWPMGSSSSEMGLSCRGGEGRGEWKRSIIVNVDGGE